MNIYFLPKQYRVLKPIQMAYPVNHRISLRTREAAFENMDLIILPDGFGRVGLVDSCAADHDARATAGHLEVDGLKPPIAKGYGLSVRCGPNPSAFFLMARAGSVTASARPKTGVDMEASDAPTTSANSRLPSFVSELLDFLLDAAAQNFVRSIESARLGYPGTDYSAPN